MKNIFMYIIVIAIVVVGVWLFMRKGSSAVSLYDASPSPTTSVSESPSPAAVATSSGSPTATPKAGPVVKTQSGLQYQDEVVGKGATAKAGDTVSVQYTGTLTNGKKFDSSYDHGGTPFQFHLGAGEVIKGWDEGVAGMKVGGTRKLVIPAALAYGSQDVGNGLIPANSTLLFEVQLVSIP